MKHGGATRKNKERLYSVWYGIKVRCTQPSATGYKDYGGRGIKMCQKWMESYDEFRTWAYSNGYNPEAPYGECTIERKDHNGDYCPENCCWANKKEQANNTRRNHYVTYHGRTMTIAQWSEELNIDQDKLWSRIYEYNMPVARAFSTNENLDETYLEYNGERHNLKEWSQITGIHVQTLSSRIHKLKWSVEKTLTTPSRKRSKNQ